MVKSKSDTNNNRGNWDHFKTIQKISEQSKGKHKIKNSKKQPHWALYTLFGKYLCNSTQYLKRKITLHVA